MGAIANARTFEQSPGQGKIAGAAAIFIVLAGLAHLLAAPQHLDHVGHGFFLLLAGVSEIAWGIAFWRRPSMALYALGVVMAGAFIMLWALTRVTPAPFGHGAGEVEFIGIFSKVAEGAGLAGLAAMVLLGARSLDVRWPAWQTILAPLTLAVMLAFILYGMGLVAERMLPWLGDDDAAQQEGPSVSAPATALAPSVSSPGEALTALPTEKALLTFLTRTGVGPNRTLLEVVYAPPMFLQAAGEEVPPASQKRPTAIFSLLEENYDHHSDFISPDPIGALLRLDKGEAVEPYEATILVENHGYRRSLFLFPLPAGMDPERLNQERHTLTFIIPLESGEQSIFTWELPLRLRGESPQPSSLDEPTKLPISALSQRLTRVQEAIEYGGKSGIKVEATFATPEYFSAAFQSEAAARYLPGRFTVFAISERLHTANLPTEPLNLSMSLDGRSYEPDMAEEITTSPHHRITLVRFPVEPPAGLRHRVMELSLPGEAVLTWHLPISYVGLGSSSGLGVTWVWLLAVLGGLVAAMWPCLFQLTVFFIPALGGLSMHEASSSVSIGRRASVVKAALFFVLGFTVVYTAAGALIGFAAGRLGDLSGFYTWQRYLGIAGGVVIIALALRVAAQVRAPLVCKMPVLSHMGQRNRPANPVEMMVAGVAFATGCMTCFGAAIVVAMVVYVGLAGSAVIGAFTLFLFSMGMGIPLVIAAMAMAKVLPVLSRFEKAIRWIGLASSLVMVGFAVLLITGNYMVLTEWVYKLLPGLPA